MKNPQLWFIALILLLTACGSAEQTEQSPLSESNTAEAEQVEPVNIGVTLDNSRAVSQVIPITGGSLTATSADGTTYTLEIPGDALLNETEISMTPVESLSGMPFSSEPTLAVQLEPDGLILYNFATLTITPAQEIPIDQQIFFGYEADGKNLSLALPEIDTDEMKILLLHFTGYAVGKGNLEHIAFALPQYGDAVVYELKNRVAELTHRERQRQQLEGRKPLAPDYLTELAKIFQEYYDRTVKVYLDIAGESCAKGDVAISTFTHYLRLSTRAGLADYIAEIDILALVEKAKLPCLQEEYNLCVQDHIIHRMLPFLSGLERQMQLWREALGLGEESAHDSALLQQARQLTEQCLRFDLEFKSTVVDSLDAIIESRVSAIVPIRFNVSTFEFHGYAPLVEEFFQYTHSNCSAINPGGVTFSAHNLSWSLISSVEVQPDPNRLGSPYGQIQDIRLQIGAGTLDGESLEDWTEICVSYDGSIHVGKYRSFWYTGFSNFHCDDYGLCITTGWEIEGGESFARLEWQNQNQIHLTESGSMVLYHRPGQ